MLRILVFKKNIYLFLAMTIDSRSQKINNYFVSGIGVDLKGESHFKVIQNICICILNIRIFKIFPNN